MSETVIRQARAQGTFRQRCWLFHAVQRPTCDSPIYSVRIFHNDFVLRRMETVSNFKTLPCLRYARIEEKHRALHSKSKNPLKTGTVHPSGGTRVPRPSATASVRRFRIDICADDVRLHLIAVNRGTRACAIDRV